MILGLRLRDMPAAGTALSLVDLQLLNLLPVTNSDKQVVFEQLKSTAKINGVPRAILGDHGSDLYGGVTLFCQSNHGTISLDDMTHQAATRLKARMKKDARWISFCSQAGQTKVKVQQVDLAFLVPPSQRSKARYMNLASLLRWGTAILSVLDRHPESVLTVLRKHCKNIGRIQTYLLTTTVTTTRLERATNAQKTIETTEAP